MRNAIAEVIDTYDPEIENGILPHRKKRMTSVGPLSGNKFLLYLQGDPES